MPPFESRPKVSLLRRSLKLKMRARRPQGHHVPEPGEKAAQSVEVQMKDSIEEQEWGLPKVIGPFGRPG